MRIKARINALQFKEAAKHQPRSNQQHERQCDFHDHNQIPKQASSGQAGSAAGPAQHIHQSGPGSAPGRSQAEKHGRGESGKDAEGEHNAVNIYALKPGKIRRRQRAQLANSRPGKCYARNSSYCSQQKRFRQEWTNQPPSTGAHGGAHCQFTLPQTGPHQQQIGDIGTGNEQKKNY